MEEKETKSTEKNTFRDYFRLGEVAGYFFRKKDPNRPSNTNIKIMHGINRISILVFLAALIILLVRHFILR